MAHTRDWSESTPLDHTKFKVQPSHVRDGKVDISDRLKTLLYGFIAGETIVAVKMMPFYAQATAPGSLGTAVVFFGSSTAGKAELFMITEDGTTQQVTSLGKIIASILGTKELDETDIADNYIMVYNGTSGKIEYEKRHAVYA